ncbi:outer membrane chaperone Skp [Moraxella macacae 0408225]|uniref:Outer membrane chaperone Skp n=1 Tax=Moraxella macacae 0408225 TaxID=1230338 RepID=L2F772_9GAMM|nr:OmpH family outer membrane protein [Moraxella macacae]ELA08308.1 outer membrane chaperone Skp [Moraxella macacae 0408225]
MKKSLLLTLITLSVGFANTVVANTVAVWNSEEAIANTNFAKSKITATQKTLAPKQQQIKTYETNLERLQQQYQSADDKQKASIAKQIDTNMKNYEQVSSQIRQTIATSQKEILDKVSPKMQSIMQNLIKQKNIDVLLDNTTETVSFVKAEFDITDDVTHALNQQVK